MKVAYVGYYNGIPNPQYGYSSSKEGSGSGYCHTEQRETLTGIKGVMGKGVGANKSLTFVSPWVTSTILNSVAADDNRTNGDITSAYTQMYVYVVVINTGQTAYVPTAGTIGLAWYSANHFDGPLIGVYYQGAFYSVTNSSALTALKNNKYGGIGSGTSYYAIYEITVHYGNSGSSSVMFWGDASITNGSNKNGEDQTYFSGTILVDGLWIRLESGTSCA